MKNKILSLVLALLMAASSASAVLANDVALIDEPAEEAAVVDEVVDGQYNKAIAFLANYGIMKGITDNDFGAELDVQRYQMALFVSRISTGWIHDHQWLKAPENWSAFTDISEGPAANYWGALSYASQTGIIEGYGDGKFGPEDKITYQNALTMVVRTLGYGNSLEWPWGYIQKAVELGLTEGITGVSYTDDLTRGEVAQIIYNAMFAKMKDGSSLAVKNFGIDFGWEKVVITASDKNVFEKKGETVKKGLVAFKILNDDGSLGEDIYYADAKEGFELEGAHDDELAVGASYYVLFEKNADEDLVKIVAIEDLKIDTLVNAGKTDDYADEQAYEIEEFKEKYALVDKYTTNEYVNINKAANLNPEVLVYSATSSIVDTKVLDKHNIAIDWNTGDILAYVLDEDNNRVDADKDGLYDLEVKWYYNELLDRYYDYKFDKSGNIVGINYMDDAEWEEYYKSTELYKTETYVGFPVITSIAKTAYADLDLYDTDLNGIADRGIYESYKLGYFYNDKKDCSHGSKASYAVKHVVTNAINAAFDGNDKEVIVDDAFEEIVESACADHGKAWFVEGYEPEVAYDEDGEAIGYKDGYVIYNYDKETGAIKVVKNIDDGSDEDSYVDTGVLRAYNVTDETLTIDDKPLTMSYNELAGNGFYLVNKNAATKAAYTATLRSLFNQFVKYVVVDGEVVHIEAVDAKSDELIVVDSYAGLSSDGYIVVNGYSTTDLEYTQFRIASYDGWMKGDYYYYMTDKAAEESFTKGAIYKITSYDKTEDVYNVYLAGEFSYIGDENGDIIYSDYYVEGIDSKQALHYAAADGYVVKYSAYTEANDKRDTDGYGKDKNEVDTTKTGEDLYDQYGYKDKAYTKMTKDDKYVFIARAVNQADFDYSFAPVIVYEGKLPEGVVVEGDLLKTDGSTYVFVNVDIQGIGRLVRDKFGAGLVVLLDDTYYSAAYNGTGAEEWYLLGASEYTVATVDILTGNLEAVKGATNKKYDEGMFYTTQGNVLTRENGFKFFDTTDIVDWINKFVPATYSAKEFDICKYTNIYDADNYKKNIEKMLIALGETSLETSSYRGDKVTGATYRVISIDEDGYVTMIDESVTKDSGAKALASYIDKHDYTSLPAFYVYDKEAKTIVIYLVESDAIATISTKKTADFTEDVWTTTDANDTIDATIKGQIVYEEVKVDGVVEEIKILGVKYYFDATDLSAKGVHAKLVADGLSFGLKGDHAAEAYKVLYSVEKTNADSAFEVKGLAHAETVWESVVDSLYADDCTVCTLVDGIYVKFNEAVVVDIVNNDDDTISCAGLTITVAIRDAEDNTALFRNVVTTAYNADQTGVVYNPGETIFEQEAYAAATATVALEEIVSDLLD